jgi:hypothetical protein
MSTATTKLKLDTKFLVGDKILKYYLPRLCLYVIFYVSKITQQWCEAAPLPAISVFLLLSKDNKRQIILHLYIGVIPARDKPREVKNAFQKII